MSFLNLSSLSSTLYAFVMSPMHAIGPTDAVNEIESEVEQNYISNIRVQYYPGKCEPSP
jgi:hypothetical protein